MSGDNARELYNTIIHTIVTLSNYDKILTIDHMTDYTAPMLTGEQPAQIIENEWG